MLLSVYTTFRNKQLKYSYVAVITTFRKKQLCCCDYIRHSDKNSYVAVII